MIYDDIAAVPCAHGIGFHAVSCSQSDTKIPDYDLVGCYEYIMVSESDALSWGSLAKYGEIRITDVKRGSKMDVSTNCKSHGSWSFSFHCMTESTLRAVICKRGHDIFLASASSCGIFSAAFRSLKRQGKVTLGRIIDIMQCLPLERSPDERSDALAVVLDDRLAEIIFEISLSHLLSAKASDSATICHRDGSVFVLTDEAVNELRIETKDIFLVRLIYISHPQALEEGICEHDRACRLLVVSFTVRAVEHLIPHTGLLVSPFREHLKEIVELVDQLLSARMLCRKIVKHLDQRYGIPAVRASPCMRRKSGLRITPEH